MKNKNLLFILGFIAFIGIAQQSYSQCTYSICLYDTYGDGWNGSTVTVTVGGSNVVSSVTLSSGYGPTCYNFTVSQGQTIIVNYYGGSWTSENYYKVYNGSGGTGTVIFSSTNGSTPPSSQTITNSCPSGGGPATSCTYSICLQDTYGDGWNGNSVTVNVAGTNLVSGVTLSSGYGPTCYNFAVTTGDAITITYSGGSWTSENYYTVYNGAGGSGTSVYSSGSGSTPPGSHSLTGNCSGGVTPPANSCLGALPFCTSNAYTFPASTNVPNMGSVGCLYTTPNPAWYWMQIGNPGNIDIYMSSGGDVDFIAWGPFTSLTAACASNLMSNTGVDCSYSTAAQETANLTNTQTGQVYVLLITNYANITTNISFSQTGGAGSTNCGIIAPPITNNGPLCVGQTLQLTVSNPTTGASYAWSGPGAWTSTLMNPTITNVTTANAGTYSLVITVGANTSPPVTTTVVINPNVTPTFAAGGTYCSGATIPANPTTSTNTITGTWSPALCNTATTTYTFTPTAGQCATTTTITITITPNTTPTFSAVGPYCSGTSISALPTTSTNGISGTWSPAINNSTTTTYTFTPTAGQCASTTTMTITISATTTPTFTALGPYCAGASIPALPTTSNNGKTGSWSPAINNNATTTYTFTPTAGQCANSTTMTITVNPNILPAFTSPPSYCEGATIPTLSNTSTNGISGTWSPAINNAATTTYTFAPTTGLCALSTTQTIVVNSNIIPSFNPVGPYCYGTPVAALSLSSTNGILGTWSPAINNTATTNYFFTPNSGQCADTTSIWVGIESVDSWLVSSTDRFCDAAGTANVIGVGGTPMYNYIWPSNALGVSAGTANNLSAGNYTVTISDAHGCQATETFTINFVNNLTSASIVASQPLCTGNSNGSVNVSVSNGTSPYNILWDAGNIVSNLSNYTINGLSQGNYTVTVLDVNGCSSVSTVNLTNPPLLVTGATFQPIKCFGETSTVQVNASGGTPPYTGTGNFSNLAGTYNYTVVDHNNCQSVVSVTIPAAPSAITINAVVNDVSCYNMNDGKVVLAPIGGTPPYLYDWNNNMLTQTINGLSNGIYSVTVSDYNLCTQTRTFEINEPGKLIFDFTVGNLLCYGASNGTLQMLADGGREPYTFEVFNQAYSANGANHTNLMGGNYTALVRDANGCFKSSNFEIISPAEISLDVNISNPSCIGNNDGSVEFIVSGGTEPYSYVFNDMFFDINFVGSLREDVYTVKLVDANSCTIQLKNITLTDIPEDCIVIPNAFTPNGDGINDTWIIQNVERFPLSVTQVFNRWGQCVYYEGSDKKPWDGLFNSKLVPAGTYIFFLNLYNGNDPYTGTVSVVH